MRTEKLAYSVCNDIKEYMHYLRDFHQLFVTVHLLKYSPHWNLDMEDEYYSVHACPLCVFFKSKMSVWNHCIERQPKVIAKAQNGSYCGMCWAGMTEFIYPLYNPDGEVSSFICVSNYCVDRPRAAERIRHVCETHNFSYERAMEIFDNEGIKVLPDKAELDVLIKPLADMCALLLLYAKELMPPVSKPVSDTKYAIFYGMMQYIGDVYTSDVTIKDLCSRYNCSASYISRLFQKYGNTSFRQEVNRLRVNLACSFLEKSTYSIQYIASITGFEDPNYFSTVFKKYTSLSPREYRNRAIAKTGRE